MSKSYLPGLFGCYESADLPRTNNDLEHAFGSHRYHERRVSGRRRGSPGLVVMGSEVGILNIEPERVKEKGRLGPGQIFLVDLAHQKIFKNDQVKRQVSHGRKYRKWITRNMVFLPRLKAGATAVPGSEGCDERSPALATRDRGREHGLFVATQRAAGYTEEETAEILGVTARTVGRDWAKARAFLYLALRDRMER